ncbi:MBL fold metallo-hydrolase [Photobacterium sp. 53610]|uniref:MBL fold metallo-hydrolase n=1 Tax=Photobacterium sp. 53610 TaxID=3102789 RepID=UPI002EDBAA2A
MKNIKGLTVFTTLVLFGGGAAISPQAVAAETSVRIQATKGSIARYQVGDAQVIALSDGSLPLDVHQLLNGASEAEINSRLAYAFRTNPHETSINAYLVLTDDRVVLIDTGAGELMGEFGGRLTDSLALAGYTPDQVTDILITHLHLDHAGGLSAKGHRVFQNATVHVSQSDMDRFLNPANLSKGLDKIDLERSQKTVGLYDSQGKVRPFLGDSVLFNGMEAVSTAGHTPGHSLYRFTSGGESIVFIGDMIHVGAVQLPKPAVTIHFDVDQNQARAQRQKHFVQLAKTRQLIAASHLNFPGVGYLRTASEGYEWVPAAYKNRD